MFGVGEYAESAARGAVRCSDGADENAAVGEAGGDAAACVWVRIGDGGCGTCVVMCDDEPDDGVFGAGEYYPICRGVYVDEEEECLEYVGGVGGGWYPATDGVDGVWWETFARLVIAGFVPGVFAAFLDGWRAGYGTDDAGQCVGAVGVFHVFIQLAVSAFQPAVVFCAALVRAGGVSDALGDGPAQECACCAEAYGVDDSDMFGVVPVIGANDVDVCGDFVGAEYGVCARGVAFLSEGRGEGGKDVVPP